MQTPWIQLLKFTADVCLVCKIQGKAVRKYICIELRKKALNFIICLDFVELNVFTDYAQDASLFPTKAKVRNLKSLLQVLQRTLPNITEHQIWDELHRIEGEVHLPEFDNEVK